MKWILFLLIISSGACNSLPQLYKSAEDIFDDRAIDIMISREAMQNEKNVNIFIEVKNISD